MNTYKSGISLIVLVITVIVLSILASAVIISVNKTNIIEEANNAIETSNLANKKYAAQLYLADYYLAKHKGTISASTTAAQYVKDQFAANNQDMSGIIVTEDGKIEEGYELPESIKLASEVAYTAPSEAGYTGKWRVLGVDNVGRIKLVSEFIDTGINKYQPDEQSDGYGNPVEAYNNNIITTINAAGAKMANGTTVISGRGINMEDINTITGFKPSTYGTSSEMRQYNNRVTYTLTNNVLTATGTNGKTATTTNTGFVPIGETYSKDGSYTVTSTYYSYYPADYGISEGSDVWNMLFEIPASTPYAERSFYITEQYIETKDDSVSWGIRYYYDAHDELGNDVAKAERITGETLWNSKSGPNLQYADTSGIKLVVTMSPNYTLADTNSDGILDIVAK